MQATQYRRSLARAGGLTALCALFLIWMAAGFTISLCAQDGPHRKIVARVNPEYPETLRMAQIGGLVRLSVTVSPNGNVSQVEVRGGNPILAEKAQQAVMKWKFAAGASQTIEDIRISFSPH